MGIQPKNAYSFQNYSGFCWTGQRPFKYRKSEMYTNMGPKDRLFRFIRERANYPHHVIIPTFWIDIFISVQIREGRENSFAKFDIIITA